MPKRNRLSTKSSEGSILKKSRDLSNIGRKKKTCEKAHCPTKEPTCIAQLSEKCCVNLWTSRWYHLSEDEHYCNECFEYFYKNSKPGYPIFDIWRGNWVRDYKGDGIIRLFMADQVLPFWVQCTVCWKWRVLPARLELTQQIIEEFVCDDVFSVDHPCHQPECISAQNALLPHWINTLSLAPMLKSSPAQPLLANYSSIPLGMSSSKLEYLSIGLAAKASALKAQATEAKANGYKSIYSAAASKNDNGIDLIRDEFSHPFLDAGEESLALAMRPDAMEEHEKIIFSEYSKEQAMYLCLRNLIYTLWMKDPTRWLTIQEVAKHLICRGLSRIRCLYEAQRILHHLTQRGLVNHGHLIPPPELPRLPPTRVIVVGGGISGLAAGRHLSNLGMKITVLEAEDRIGGRVHCIRSEDDGLTLSAGADLVIGAVNNPLIALAYQCGARVKVRDEKQMILHPGGTIVDPSVDESVDEIFGTVIGSLVEYRQNVESQTSKTSQKKSSNSQPPPPEPDHDLENELILTFKKLFPDLVFSEEEKPVMESCKSVLEISCGAPLSKMSSIMFMHNTLSPHFSEGNATVSGGIGALLEDLSGGLEVRPKCEVSKVELVDSDQCRVKVTFTSETDEIEVLDADYVVVAVPLTVLQKEKIEFVPNVPSAFKESLGFLAAGQMEKIVAEFPHSFWRPSNEEHRCGMIMRTMDETFRERGLFPFFQDVSSYDKDGVERYLLQSYINGETVENFRNLSESEITAEYVKVLRKYFGEIPEPLQCKISRFSINPHIGIAYSYCKVGCSPEDLRPLGDPVINNTVFFAGEYLNQQNSRNLAWAYLSGLDAASRIVQRCLYGDDIPYVQNGF